MVRLGPIVVIEDDEDDQMFISRALAEIQPIFRVQVFDNAEEVLTYLGEVKEQPFLIICDVNLPRVNGIELRSRINENEYLKKKSIPFVFVATSDSQDKVNAAYELTIQGFFKKPESFPELKQLLSKILDYWINCRHPNNFGTY